MNPRTVAYAVAAGSRSERAGTIAGGHRACPLVDYHQRLFSPMLAGRLLNRSAR